MPISPHRCIGYHGCPGIPYHFQVRDPHTKEWHGICNVCVEAAKERGLQTRLYLAVSPPLLNQQKEKKCDI